MYAKITVTGNSACIIIPKGILNEYNLSTGDFVEIPEIRKLNDFEITEFKKKGYIK